MEKRAAVAAFIVRIGLGLIFLYTGISKLFLGMSPPLDRVLPFIPINISTYFLGLLEFVLAIFLLAGLITRIVAWISVGVYALSIIVGLALGLFNAAALFKDIGLLAASVSTALLGSTIWGMDNRMRRTPQETPAQLPPVILSATPALLYFASKEHKLYHQHGCIAEKSIHPENLIRFADKVSAHAKGLKPCRCVRRKPL